MRRWEEIPFATLTPSLALGIALSRFITEYLFLPLAIAALCILGSALIAWARMRPQFSFWLVHAALVHCGLLLALSQRDGYSSSDVRALWVRSELPLDELLLFDGCMAEDPIRYGEDLVAAIDLRAIRKKDSWVQCRGGLRLRIPNAIQQSDPAGEAFRIKAGDRLRGWVEWTTPNNYQNPGAIDRIGYLKRRGIFLLGKVRSQRLVEILPGDCRSAWESMAQAAREKMIRNLSPLQENQKAAEKAILASLLIGDYSGLDGQTREIFQNSGTYHVLVVSGLHVTWLAGILFLLFRWIRIPAGGARLLVAFSIYFYSCIVGFQASVTRCLWMLILYLIGQSMFRRADPANLVLAAGFSLLTFKPDWLFDAGFQLSFVSVLAICILALPLIKQVLLPMTDPLRHAGDQERFFLEEGRWHRIGRKLRIRCELVAEACADRFRSGMQTLVLAAAHGLGRGFFWLGSMWIISGSIQIWIEPILAFYFNRLSWIAPIANLLVVPLSSVVLGLGILASICPVQTGLSHILVEFAGHMSALLLGLVRQFSELPAAWQRCPTPTPPWILVTITALFFWQAFRWRRSWLPVLLASALLAWLATAASPTQEALRAVLRRQSAAARPFPDESAVLRLTFLDVGEGDCVVMVFPGRQCWLIDAGGIRQPQSEEELSGTFDIGEAVVSRYLWFQWILRLDRVLLTHPDLDHAGGIPAVIRNLKVERLQYGEDRPDAILSRILAAASERKTILQKVRTGDAFQVGQILLRIINPGSIQAGTSSNDNSVVLRLTYKRFSALFTGDLERTGEQSLLSGSSILRSLLLKVSHHGSRTATQDAFIDRVKPRWAVISAGKNNPFGHPAPEVMHRLLAHQARPVLTSQQGAIHFETDGSSYLLSSHRAGILEHGPL